MKELTYEEVLDRIEHQRRFGNRPGAEVSALMLEKLGKPQQDMSVIHIAGTNGKGSVSAFLCSILKEAGIRTGMFTSPHLVDFRERICVDGQMISREEVTKLGNMLLEEDFGTVPTMFDYCLAMALLDYRDRQCQAAVIETGLGGRLDSTNAIGVPEVTVITKIGYDHMAILGDTLDKIAAEKAGVIKKGTKLVMESQEQEAMEVLLKTAEKEEVTEPKIADIRDVTECRYENGRQYFSYKKYKNLEMTMLGVHQYENAAAAILAAEIFLKDRGISENQAEYYIREGIRKTRWEGRMEILNTDPFLMVDGAHNGNGVAALAESLRTLFPGEKFHFVMGVMADKNYDEMIEELLPLALDFKTVTVESERALAAQELSEKIRAKGICDAGLLHSYDELKPGRLDVSCKTIAFGSLYFVGEIKKYFLDVTKITK
ncbi:MAG TPA: bifunctional folylpolyglutamate synthase/dihydrofolate synthase [Roseburia sp.]|nr:bifunctional folylpolyglutamate synthase/dihydrofolate synthase [Roseburia sp.]